MKFRKFPNFGEFLKTVGVWMVGAMIISETKVNLPSWSDCRNKKKQITIMIQVMYVMV